MPEIEPKTVIERFRRAKERRTGWEAQWQFSCWNPNDPNRAKILEVDPENRTFASCLRIARRAVAGVLADPTDGATHYHVRGLAPPWAVGRRPSAEIGRHLFYNDVE